MPRYQRNGEIVDAIRYRPGWPGHIVHRMSEAGIPCVHLRPATETIDIFSGDTSIAIQDHRHDLGGTEGVIYPGDWIVWRSFLEIEIVPSPIFEAEYSSLS